MHIGVLKEVKPDEYRVPVLPGNVRELLQTGHEVTVESGAGAGAGFLDEAYREAGAHVVSTAWELSEAADLLVKVKEPVEDEFAIFRPGQILFCYLHSETRPKLVDMLLERRLTAVAFENVRESDGSAPLLRPMSVIAGQQAVLQGMQFLWNHRGGVGKSLVVYPGLEAPVVVVLGAGVAGREAARVAAALGCRVHVFEINQHTINAWAPMAPPNVHLHNVHGVDPAPYVITADMVVNTATVPPHSHRHLIDRHLVRRMKKGSVIVDVTANLQGAVETIDRYTTHSDPVWEVDGVIHFAVTNIPGAVAHTASQALALEVYPYLRLLADHGIPEAFHRCGALLEGVTAMGGCLTWREAGVFQGRSWMPPEKALESLWPV
ncbi:alanine dehydrogenase [Desulfacinum hydrothermale DSM 13146]|uniref:Alanine dehydrogenase n=1 Tax=Desulfacinum hydrothermale DSM 13146 TaxID=1121390 RepID=A0A1W1XLY7_9BACT|nr:NAD(P)-dependent oxidoreductase [Desulfacinum hydrothermale]SMC24989.1 alanine dehydrogenase [Desulfacinum hydrothermale DSM 13146]